MKFKIYCINLYERDDRYNYVKKEFNKYNLDVHFVRNHKHKLGGRYGCFDSHIQCLKDAKKNNIDVCLVFEDDIRLTSNCHQVIQNCLNFIKGNKQTDIIYANGRFNLYLDKFYCNDIYSGKSFGADCIFITKKMIKIILTKYKKYIFTKLHYDHFLYFFAKNSFISTKYIVTTEPFGSDNDVWNNNLNYSQKLTNYTTIFFKINNFIIINIFKLLVDNNLSYLKNTLIKKIDKKCLNKGLNDIYGNI
jgi:GR25 family glycosyltransferase involved in LPS biosynthesis